MLGLVLSWPMTLTSAYNFEVERWVDSFSGIRRLPAFNTRTIRLMGVRDLRTGFNRVCLS